MATVGDRPLSIRPGPAGNAWPWLTLAAIWCLAHPYEGLRHDAILYAAQAMRHLEPEVFSRDLFFRWGSQDDFTLFGQMYAVAMSALGLPWATRLLFALGQVLWFGAAFGLCARTLSGPWAAVGAAFLFATRFTYSPGEVIGVAEPFLTARLIAEPLALLALLAYTMRRRTRCAMLLVASCAIHPLIAAPVLGVIALHLFAEWRGWRAAFAAVLVVLAVFVVACVCVGPERRFDEAWYGLIRLRSPFASPQEWAAADVARYIAQLTILAAASRLRAGPWPGLWAAAALTGAIGLALTGIGGASRWALVLQAQPWRVMWVAGWLSALALVCCAVGPHDGHRRVRALALAGWPAIALMQLSWPPVIGWIALAYAVALAWSVARPAQESGPLGDRLVYALGAVLALLAIGAGALEAIAILHTAPADFAVELGARALLVQTFGWFVFPAAVAASVGLARRRGIGRRAPAALAAAMVCSALAWVDGRGARAKTTEQLAVTGLAAWQEAIPARQSVFWPERASYVWFGLHRTAYVSRTQLAGLMFSRPTAIEGHRRTLNVARIGGRDAVFAFHGAYAVDPDAAFTRADVARACEDPELGFVVLRPDFGVSTVDPFVEPGTGKRFFLYDCRAFRTANPAQASSRLAN